MEASRLAALLQPFLRDPLSEFQLKQILTYIDLLLKWTVRINLTAIRNEEEVATRHFGESFFLAGHILNSVDRPVDQPDQAGEPPTKVLDIGSGAGFPALPMKIYCPHIHLTMIESNHKKVAFLREVVRVLRLTDVDVRSERAETLSADPEFPRFNVVTFRAVERFPEVLKTAAQLVCPNGRLALLIGEAQVKQLGEAREISWLKPSPIPGSHTNVAIVGTKVKW